MDMTKKNLTDIIPYENNPRKNDQAVDAVAESIRQCGYVAPIIVDENGVILAGHTRLKAMKKLGMTECEVVVKEGLTEEQKKKYRLLDNKTAELSEWDFEKLAEEIDGLDFGDLELDWRVDLDKDSLTAKDDGDAEDLPDNPKSNIGDVYILGRHRLMCGDSTNPDDVAILMDNKKAAILFTSPPYSDLRTYKDGMDVSVNHIAGFIEAFSPYVDIQNINLGLVFRDREVVPYWNEYIEKAKSCGYKLMAWNVWDKGMVGSIGAQTMTVPLQHEWIFVFGRCAIKLNRSVKKKETSIKADKEFRTGRQPDGSMKVNTAGDQFHRLKKMGSVVTVTPVHDTQSDLKQHPARFPVGLPTEYINAMTNEGESVIDCFGGSGTTLIACEQLNRTCYMMELDPKYIDLTIDRWERLTGKKAVKLDGETAKGNRQKDI